LSPRIPNGICHHLPAKGGKLPPAAKDRIGDGALIDSVLAAANLFLDLVHRGRVVLNARVA
jgi:hypothetical protein